MDIVIHKVASVGAHGGFGKLQIILVTQSCCVQLLGVTLCGAFAFGIVNLGITPMGGNAGQSVGINGRYYLWPPRKNSISGITLRYLRQVPWV